MDGVREQIMINQFMYVAGCSAEQAKHFLQESKWHFETALSMFFQDGSLVQAIHACGGNPAQCKYPLCTPANTPATPPNFPEALTALSRLSASDRYTSPSETHSSWLSMPSPGAGFVGTPSNSRHDDSIAMAPPDQVSVHVNAPAAQMPGMR